MILVRPLCFNNFSGGGTWGMVFNFAELDILSPELPISTTNFVVKFKC